MSQISDTPAPTSEYKLYKRKNLINTLFIRCKLIANQTLRAYVDL